ncbi:glycosyltransferase family 4 protein [Nocardia sp. NPDC057440]|uniref:glycosyltransferase family 4 protein n=1 Tax=Nocardia sp. NPDC057440 TaxID=3346134 RepID=UPI0036714972
MGHTHHLLDELARRHPRTRFTVTITGGEQLEQLGRLQTPDGPTVDLFRVATHFPQLICGSGSTRKDAELVHHFYDERVDDQHNPVWVSLAHQYTSCVTAAETHDLVLQNINSLVAVLKAVETGLLNSELRLTGVIHDATGASGRFRYIARHVVENQGPRISLIAVSESIRSALCESGIPAERVRKITNGMDVDKFHERIRHSRATNTFSDVRRRNNVPPDTRIILMSARRVPWKGHEDLIQAAALLMSYDGFDDGRIVINGAGLLDSRSMDYEFELRQLITDLQLTDKVFLLDRLTREEVAACYAAAYIAVLPSRDPEPFGYANIEAMLAGAPVIATAHGGPLEYIEDGVSGVLVPPRNPSAIASAIHWLLHDAAAHNRIGTAGRASAGRFTVDAMIDAYDAVICGHADGSIKGGNHDDVHSRH